MRGHAEMNAEDAGIVEVAGERKRKKEKLAVCCSCCEIRTVGGQAALPGSAGTTPLLDISEVRPTDHATDGEERRKADSTDETSRATRREKAKVLDSNYAASLRLESVPLLISSDHLSISPS